MIEMQRTMLQIQKLAMKYGERFNLKSDQLRGLHDTLTKMQVAAHLVGQRSAQEELSKQGLKLSALDTILDKLKRMNRRSIDKISAHYSFETMKVVQEMTTSINRNVRKALNAAAEDKLHTRTATQIFAEALNKSGITPKNSYYAENIVRTHTQIAYNAARWIEYEEEGVNEILWGYTYATVGDDRVRYEHEILDGVTLPKDDPFWLKFFPPNGYSCRCQAIPLFDKERIKRPPKDAAPDEGFDFNPGELAKHLLA